MTTPVPQNVTQLLLAWNDGDRAALEKLAPMVEAELHRLALHCLKRERPDHTLQPTALVNEAMEPGSGLALLRTHRRGGE